MYALDHEEAEAAGNVVEGKLIVSDHEAKALFDLGSTHSFIARHFPIVIGGKPKQLQVVLIVTTLVGRKVLHEMFYLHCRIQVGEFVMPTYLTVLAMHNFDVILGMG